MSGTKWVVATHNRDKLREIRAIFADFPVDLLDLDTFPHIEAVEETGTNLLENALLKARSIYQVLGYPAIADDTGLEVHALNGAPGIFAARYAGPQATYLENQTKLLNHMQQIPDEDRTAQFRTCAVYVDGTHEISAEGSVMGHITREPQGTHGFGYDPVFHVDEAGCTFGQMTQQEKQIISHRARAFKLLNEQLAQIFRLNDLKEAPPRPY